MPNEWKMQSYGLAAAAQRLGATLLMAVFFVALILPAGQAQACPPGMKADTSVVAYAAKRIVLFASAIQPVNAGLPTWNES
jgi:hypothetical protein